MVINFKGPGIDSRTLETHPYKKKTTDALKQQVQYQL